MTNAAFHLQAAPGDVLAIRLSVTNRMIGPAVIAPQINDWIESDGTVHQIPIRITPDYCYLQQGCESTLTLTAVITATLSENKELFSDLRFPGIEQEILPLNLSICKQENEKGKIWEHRIAISLPLAGKSKDEGQKEEHQRDKMIHTLLAAIAGLEVIPSRWFVTEMLFALCESGLTFRKTPQGSELLAKLNRTRFFKNGAIIFRGAQISNWASVGLTITSGLQSVFGGISSHGGKPYNNLRMITTWENWLFSLAETDIESSRSPGSKTESTRYDPADLLQILGTDNELWFAAFILGLYTSSARTRVLIDSLCERIQDPPVSKKRRTVKKRKVSDILDEKGSLQR